MKEFLDRASEAYYQGNPVISDEVFDRLAEAYGYKSVGFKPKDNTKPHAFQMFSLDKHYVGEGNEPLQSYREFEKVKTVKLDGAAVSITYQNSILLTALTRGDGVVGTDITDKFLHKQTLAPLELVSKIASLVQITGEVVAPKDIENARNYAAGALSLKDLNEFSTRELYFIAYDIQCSDDNTLPDSWSERMKLLEELGFNTVVTAKKQFISMFPTDGEVVRLDSVSEYNKLGYTSKFPRAAYAIKTRAAPVKTKLLDVTWQVGKTGKVTPVAILEPIVVGDATISRATLNNMAFIQELGLKIGATVHIIRAGEIIPKVVGVDADD